MPGEENNLWNVLQGLRLTGDARTPQLDSDAIARAGISTIRCGSDIAAGRIVHAINEYSKSTTHGAGSGDDDQCEVTVTSPG